MVKVGKCSFCGKDISPGTGVMLVKNDGSIFHFCSSKCFKSFKLGRDPKRTPWSSYFLGKKQSV